MAQVARPLDRACEHLTTAALVKIKDFRSSSATNSASDPHFSQYRCVDCSTSGSFPFLEKHYSKTKHIFAVSSSTLFCAQCNDLIYEPGLVLQNAKKRKLAQANLNEEDEAYMTTNTSQRPCGREGVRGLFNLGETCYMNAVLQMMVHNPLLASYFLGMGHPVHLCPISKEPEKKNDSDSEDDDGSEDKPEQKACVACGMTEVFSDTIMADQPLPAHAVNLLFASWKNIPVSSPFESFSPCNSNNFTAYARQGTARCTRVVSSNR
jgi:ubiquitin carboxyl-terminal hydrolase 22/27/51